MARAPARVMRRQHGAKGAAPTIATILIKLEFAQFDSNPRQIRAKFDPKLRFIANDSFNPVC